MDRRKALKHMGAIAATTAYSTSIISLLASCKDEAAKGLAWKPISFSADQANTVSKLLDVFIPSGEIPGALDLGIERYLDKHISGVMNEEGRKMTMKGLAKVMSDFQAKKDVSIADASKEDIETYLTETFVAHKEKMEAASPEEMMNMKDPVIDTLYGIRGMGLWAWKNSKTIATEHMWYDPIPQKYVGCRDLQAEGDGKLMGIPG